MFRLTNEFHSFQISGLTKEQVIEFRFWKALEKGDLKSAEYWNSKHPSDLMQFIKATASSKVREYGQKIGFDAKKMAKLLIGGPM